jgi:HlyD family secretion protein
MARRCMKSILAVIAVALAVWQVTLLLDVLHGTSEAGRIETAAVKNGPFIVGIAREGKIESADVLFVKAPRSGRTITWLIEDGAKVKEGDIVAKMDTGDYRFEVERQRLEYENRMAQVEQERRDRTRDSEGAEMDVERTLRSLEVLTSSQLTEREQSGAQVSFDEWRVTWYDQDYQKQSRLSATGIVPETKMDQAERILRSQEYALTKSEKDAEYLGSEHASEKAQSQADIGKSEFEAELAEKRIDEAVLSAKKRERMAAEQYEEMKGQLEAGDLRSPTDGVVVLGFWWDENGRRTIKEGDRVYPGWNIAEVTNLSSLQVKLRVEEAAVSGLKVGQKAAITVKTAPDREFAGEISTIGAVAHTPSPWEDPEALPGRRVFDVIVTIEDADPEILRPGIDADVQLISKRIPKAVYLPIEAIFDRSGGQTAYVKKGDRFVARKVKTGERNEKAVTVLEGLKPGESVALSDPTRGETS